MELRGRKVTVMGLGRFGGGLGAALFAADQGAQVTVTDLKPADQLGDSVASLADRPVTLHLGAHHEPDFREADVVVVLAGLGGGTGSGAAPVVAEMARRRGAMAIALSTLPFSVEGTTRKDNAAIGQTNLARCSDMSVVMPNDHLLETSPNLSLVEAFRTADDSLLEPVRLLRRLLTRGDMPRLRTALDRTGRVHLGRGESNRALGYGGALEEALARLHPPTVPRACDRGLIMFRAGLEGPDEDASAPAIDVTARDHVTVGFVQK